MVSRDELAWDIGNNLLGEFFDFAELGQLLFVLLDAIAEDGHDAFGFERDIACDETDARRRQTGPHFDLLEHARFGRITRFTDVDVLVGETFRFQFEVLLDVQYAAPAADLTQRVTRTYVTLEQFLLTFLKKKIILIHFKKNLNLKNLKKINKKFKNKNLNLFEKFEKIKNIKIKLKKIKNKKK